MGIENQEAVSSPVRVVVAGPEGRMGRVMMDRLPSQGVEVVGGLRRDDREADELLAAADVLVEFTNPESALELMLRAIRAGVRPVSGTSGVTEMSLQAVDTAAREHGIGAVWASSFGLGNMLMAHFAEIATRYFDAVEIVEAHHVGKADAPSGTALELTRRIRLAHGSDVADAGVARETLPGTRGGVNGGVRVHSLRLPGVLGWHEVIFSGASELLTIRHDDFDRGEFVAPVAIAARHVMQPGVVGLVRGLEAVVGLRRSAEGQGEDR
jgi:4-hydroxy-tetrahydrodipicolinate reductase